MKLGRKATGQNDSRVAIEVIRLFYFKGGSMKRFLLSFLFLLLCNTADAYYFTGDTSQVLTRGWSEAFYDGYYDLSYEKWRDGSTQYQEWYEQREGLLTFMADPGEPNRALATITIDVSLDWISSADENVTGIFDTGFEMGFEIYEYPSYPTGPSLSINDDYKKVQTLRNSNQTKLQYTGTILLTSGMDYVIEQMINVGGFSTDNLTFIGEPDRNVAFFKSKALMNVSIGFKPVPEPSTILLFGLGILGLAGVSRKKK